MTTAHGVIDATLSGYAYETTLGQAILAGDRGRATREASAADRRATAGVDVDDIPGRRLPSLGLLSLGAAGLSVWRRQNW